MDANGVGLVLGFIGTACWGICFWWMHRISTRQDDLLEQLHEQGRRIEMFSKIEHDLIREVHPQVGEIKEGLEEVIETVKDTSAKEEPVRRR